jgi:CheY-like chemotaxis protein
MKRVLVVDDEPPIGRLISAALDAAGVEHTMDYCSDGGQGRVKAAQGQYDLITLDLHMPLMGGIEALREIKQNPKSAHIPVVVVTGQKDPAFHKRAWELGADALITKPFKVEGLGSILSQLLAGEEVESRAGGGEDADLRPLNS